MKRAFLPMLALLIAFSLSAFSLKTSTNNTKNTVYYWFDTGSTYLGHTSADPPACNGGTVLCAKGYISVDDPSNPSQPAGTADRTAFKNH